MYAPNLAGVLGIVTIAGDGTIRLGQHHECALSAEAVQTGSA